MNMDDSDFGDELQELFADAVELEPSRRASFLSDRCAGRPELRAEIESLITAHDRSDRFLDLRTDPLAAQHDPEAFRDERGRAVGQFRLLERIGEGGMGVVYRAERVDGEFTQRVAIKLIDSPLRNPDTMRRFRAERQILATLHHPHIVTLLDGGVTDDGQAYLVMECVDGVPITAYCTERGLGLDDRLRLFRDMCGAVQDAHQHGVVHRDLKPSNILVTAEGVPKILDFGVAKLVDATGPDAGQTLPGAAQPLTPNYASPEQVRGLPVTTVSDIYALGVLLYELLTDVRPYDTADKTVDEILRIVADAQPPRPSARVGTGTSRPPYDARRLRGDLDAIVLKAMSKEPARRYASARELSEDLARHLAGQPVLAREPSFGYIAQRLATRHRAAFLSASASLVVIMAALTLAIWQARVATIERDRARLESEKANQVVTFLRSLFWSGAPSHTKGETLTVQDVLDNGVTRIERELAGQPGVQATMLGTLGLVYTELSLHARAVPLLERSLALRERSAKGRQGYRREPVGARLV